VKSSLAPSSTGSGGVDGGGDGGGVGRGRCERGQGRVLIYKGDGVDLDHRF
jgi:hypothetical protein